MTAARRSPIEAAAILWKTQTGPAEFTRRWHPCAEVSAPGGSPLRRVPGPGEVVVERVCGRTLRVVGEPDRVDDAVPGHELNFGVCGRDLGDPVQADPLPALFGAGGQYLGRLPLEGGAAQA